ncbi:MAG: 2OG-Fe dioxygenase family protein [Lysobacterales bacterium]
MLGPRRRRAPRRRGFRRRDPVGREGIKGGETRVFEAAGPWGQRFTLAEPWSMLLLDDARMIHETTPIQPLGEYGHRDTLVLTFRENAFQGED